MALLRHVEASVDAVDPAAPPKTGRTEWARLDEASTMGVQTATAPRMAPAWRYLPEVDGLRAIAVLSVFFFHLDRGLINGGFVGVDVFFVVSGFLISSILLQDIDKREFSIPRFYQHRIARIAPALFLMLLLTLGGGAVIYSAQDFASLGVNAAAAAISAINIKLLFQGGYFQASRDAQALLHCWTLAVEEQFYLLFPPLLFLLTRYVRRQLALTLAICGASFALCIVLTAAKPLFAFYLLPTRAWELLAGFSLALFRRSGGVIAPALASSLGWIGFVALFVSFFAIRQSDVFPGWIAALPVAGAVLVLASICNASGLVSRILGHPWAVFVGKRSYSLYLWHWSVFSFVDYALFQSPLAPRILLKIAISIAGTLATYELVEKPARRFLNLPTSRPLAFVGFGLSTAAILILGVYVRSHDYLSVNSSTIASGGITVNSSGQEAVVLVGDSQGAMYGTELASMARSCNFHLNVLAVAGGNELAGEPNTEWPEVERYLADHKPDVLIVAEDWSGKLDDDPAALRRAIAAAAAYARRVIVLAQPPVVPPNASRQAIRDGARPPFFERPEDRAARQLATVAAETAAGGKVEVVDMAAAFLTPSGAIRLIGSNGRLTYMDPFHLSDTGTALIHARLAQLLCR